jgi:predicted unusual protein kinase regulating ubiquinone biosynthesis (AarF/ABC1/UbiB family)
MQDSDQKVQVTKCLLTGKRFTLDSLVQHVLHNDDSSVRQEHLDLSAFTTSESFKSTAQPMRAMMG